MKNKDKKKTDSTSKTDEAPWAVVTGASSGIGLELAKVFAKNGYNLLVAAEDAEIFEVRDSIDTDGTEIEAVQADLSTDEGVETLYEKIQLLGHPVDVVALNAGVGVGGEFLENDLEEELEMIDLNIVSTVHLAKIMLRDFVEQGYGKMLFTSSVAGESPGPYLAVYSATKAFVQSFAEAIRFEIKDSHPECDITITALQPGATDTGFFERAGMMDTKVGQAEKDDPAQVAQQGFDALMAGKDHVIAGAYKNKIQTNISKMLPQQTAAKSEAKQVKPGSADRP